MKLKQITQAGLLAIALATTSAEAAHIRQHLDSMQREAAGGAMFPAP